MKVHWRGKAACHAPAVCGELLPHTRGMAWETCTCMYRMYCFLCIVGNSGYLHMVQSHAVLSFTVAICTMGDLASLHLLHHATFDYMCERFAGCSHAVAFPCNTEQLSSWFVLALAVQAAVLVSKLGQVQYLQCSTASYSCVAFRHYSCVAF